MTHQTEKGRRKAAFLCASIWPASRCAKISIARPWQDFFTLIFAGTKQGAISLVSESGGSRFEQLPQRAQHRDHAILAR